MKALVYTSIYGGFDTPIEQPKQTVDTNFIMFSDIPIKSESWFNVVEDRPEKTPRMQAKYRKLHPPVIVKDWNIKIWIDGSVKILREDFVEKCIEWIGDNNMLLFEHPDRDCIYDEAELSSTLPKYKGQRCMEQVAHYRKEGVPEYNGLYACTVIARRGDTSKFDEAWWLENKEFGYQDQLSFGYLAWKHKIYPETFPFYQYRNPYVDCSAMNRHLNNN